MNMRNKIEICLGLLIIFLLVIHSVFANTIISDTTIVSNDFIGDLTGDVKGEISNTLLDTVNNRFNLSTMIYCSNGNIYSATAANLQTAIALGGHVKLPASIISVSTGLVITKPVELEGCGDKSVLKLADNANVTVLSAENVDGVKISNFKIDGNGKNQPVFKNNQHPHLKTHCIDFRNVTNSIIQGCNITNGTFSNIYWWNGSNNIIRDCFISNAGLNVEGTFYLGSIRNGLLIQSMNDFIISNCIFDNNYGTGCAISTHYQLVYNEASFSKDFIIEDCIATNNHMGFYIDRAMNGELDTCIAYHNNRYEAYGATSYSSGFVYETSINITTTGCISNHNGNGSSGTYGRGFTASTAFPNSGLDKLAHRYLIGGNLSFIGCTSKNNYAEGIVSNFNYTKIMGCTIADNKDKSILMGGLCPSIIGNTITGGGDDSIELNSISGKVYNTRNWMGVISGNTITKPNGEQGLLIKMGNISITGNTIIGDLSAGRGIWIYGMQGANHTAICSNIIYGCSDGIYLHTSINNTVTGNIVSGCTSDGIEEVGASDGNIITGNVCSDNADTTIDTVGGTTILEHNQGQ